MLFHGEKKEIITDIKTKHNDALFPLIFTGILRENIN
jgi:hypothetical protein